MSLYIGNKEIIGVYVGSTEISNAYVGSSQIYGGVSIDAVKFMTKQANSTIGLTSLSTGQTLEYSTDGDTWTNMTTATTISLTSGQSVYVRGILTSDNTTNNYTKFAIMGDVVMSGKLNTLFNYLNVRAPLFASCGFQLFQDCSGLTDISRVIFPSTGLAENCFKSMFERCCNIEIIPSKLPATTLANGCYDRLFQDCSSLVDLSNFILPATTLTQSCYYQMFKNCTSLTTPPELPATTLAPNCYRSMFNSCANLTTPPALPATTLATYCYFYMFENCSALATAPELPATILAARCYEGMFKSCSSLNYIKCLATDISANTCTTNWVSGVASTGTFVKDPNMSGWTTGNNGIPSGWTIEDNHLKWTPTPSGLLSTSGVTYSDSTWTFGTDEDGDYYTNNGMGQMIALGYQINGTERFRIKFKYDHTDGRQLLGNSYSYNDGEFSYRLFLYEGQTFDMGSVGGGFHRISTQISAENVLLDYEIGNYYIKDYNGSVIVQGTPNIYVAPQNNMLYVGTDGDSTIKIYGIEVLI